LVRKPGTKHITPARIESDVVFHPSADNCQDRQSGAQINRGFNKLNRDYLLKHSSQFEPCSKIKDEAGQKGP
jgi:hypothetical protein